MTTIHPVNLALLQHFFDDSFVNNIFADTFFSKAVNVSLPKLQLYEHKMSNILAADTKAHLSLSKMASTAKKDAIIFQNLAEPLLDGQIKLNPDWPSTDNILLYMTSSATIILTVVLVWTIFKLRKLTTALLVVERVQKTKALVTDIPSFIYEAKLNELNKDSSTIDFSIDLTWEQTNFILLCSLLTIIVVYLWKCYKLKHKSKLCLEITCGTKCSLIDIIQLPVCPSYYDINVPLSITDLEVKGHWYSPKLYVSWPGFSIRNTLTDDVTIINSELSIDIFTARTLRTTSAKPFFVYMYKLHHGVLIPIRQT